MHMVPPARDSHVRCSECEQSCLRAPLENRELSLALDTAIAPDLIAAVESTFDADFAAVPPQ
jgi:hypothetical protein